MFSLLHYCDENRRTDEPFTQSQSLVSVYTLRPFCGHLQVQQMTAIALSTTLSKGSRSFSSGVITAEDVEHATGLER